MSNRISLTQLILLTLSLTQLSETVMAATDVSPERPLGRLFSPLPEVRSGQIPDVFSPVNRAEDPSANGSQVSAPPLGMLLTPLSDGDRAKTESPLAAPSDLQFQSNFAAPSAGFVKGSNVTNARPLGLLLDQATFRPVPQNQSGLARETSPQTTSPPIYAPPPLAWGQHGATGARPLGTLLVPGTYRPNAPIAQPALPALEPVAPLSRSTSPSLAPDLAENPSVNFSADEMGFDRESGIVTAQGNVEVSYQDRILRADKVTYNRGTNEVTAEGNVVIIEPTNETIFGDRIEVSGDLRDGFILNIGIILQDRSRIAGSSATRTGGIKTQLNQAVYSPCNLCDEDPDTAPLWQIKAVNVTHDKNAKIVEYEDAWLEFFGVPVFYTPYFRHPDPTVKRQSGMLFPTFGNSSDLGTIFKLPFFWDIAPNEDATITPIIMTAENPILAVQYRKRLTDGKLDVEGSLTASPDDAASGSSENGRYGLRGHIESEGRFDINEAWRWGFDGDWTTDDTYLRRFGFSSPTTLESQIYAESFRRQNYFSVKALSFQGLQSEDRSETTPVVLPMVDFNYVGDKDRFGGTTNFDFNFLALTREEGLDTRRLSARSKWQRPFVGKLGDVYNVSFGLNSDLYHVNELSRGSNRTNYDGLSYRVTPEAAIEWRMPFAKSDGNVSQVVEPIASFIWSPYGGNSIDIPNEDSIELEFDDTNLFRTNRFSGLDRVEGGPRMVYGLKWGAFGSDGGKSSVFIGQSWRPKTDDTYVVGSGLEGNFSDVVARMNISPGPHFDASYRTRLAQEDLTPNKHEISANAGVPALRLSGTYTFLQRQTGSEFTGREELDMRISSQIDRFWRTGINGKRDIDVSEMRSAGMHLTYEDECIVFTSRISRTFFQDRDLEPTDSITFNLVLKTLGEVKTGGSLF